MANGSSELGGDGANGPSTDLADCSPGPSPHGQRLHPPFVSEPAIGKIKRVVGSVTVTRANVIVAPPVVGDLVYKGDWIETGVDGLIAIVFVDGTTFRLDDSAHMVLDEFVFSSERSSNSALFRVLNGRFSFLSGLVATTGRLMIDTAVARIQNTRPAAGIGGLAFSVFTIGLIHELNAASADIALLDDGTITCKDLKHGVFEIITKGANPQRFVVDDPCVSINFQIVGSQIRVSEVANTPGQMALFHDAFVSTLNNYLEGQSFIQKWEHANADNPQSTGSTGSSTQPGNPTGLASLLSSDTTPINVSGGGSGGSTSGSSSSPLVAVVDVPLNVIWDSNSGTWPTSVNWNDGAAPLPIQNVIIDNNDSPTKVTFDTNASILGLTIEAGAILNIVGGSLTVTEATTNSGLIEINSSGADPIFAITGNISLLGDGEIWLRPPPLPDPGANMIIAVGPSTLTNVNNTVFGSGTIGKGDGALTLVNEAAGTIDALGGTLILDTGNAINNSGILAAGLVTAATTTLTGSTTGSGTLQINDVVDNAGLVEAAANGILDIQTDLITWTGGTAVAGINGILLYGTLLVDVPELQLTGGGAVLLAGGAIAGAAGTDVLDDVNNPISGYGTIGGAGGALTLLNEISVTIDANVSGQALLIDALTLFTNFGLLEANGGVLAIESTPVTNTTELLATGGGTVVLEDGTVITNTGATVEVDAGSTLDLATATISGGNVSVAGTLNSTGESFIADGTLSNTGTIVANGGVLDVGSNVSGNGTVTITDGGIADFANAFSGDVLFAGAGSIEFARPYSGTMSGFGNGDLVDLTNYNYSTNETAIWTENSSNTGGALTINNNTQPVETINLSGSYAQDNFALQMDSGTGTEVVFVTPPPTTTLTFDNLPPPSPSSAFGETAPIPNGYGGLNWSNFFYLDSSDFPNSGYANGMVSTPYVAFNESGESASVSGTTFNFIGADLTAAWNNGLSITVDGYDNGALVDQKTVVVNTTAPTWFEFDFNGVTDVVFSSSGGTNAGYNGLGTEFVMADFTISDLADPDVTIGAGASFQVGSASADTVLFTASTGTLILAQPASFTGEIAGISGSGDILDLKGLETDTTATTGSGSYNSVNGTTTLTVTDSSQHLSITLVGDYSDSTFTVTNDNSGGVDIADPPTTSVTIADPSATGSPAADGVISFAVADPPSPSGNPANASFTPEGSGYVGTFSLDPVSESNGSGSVRWEFNLGSDQINLPAGQTETQSYGVTVTEGQNAPVNQTVSVSIGGPGNDNFVFHPGVGADTIINFNAQLDTIELDRFANAQSIQHLAAVITSDAHGDAVIELGHNDSITIPGLTANYLQAHLQSLVHLH